MNSEEPNKISKIMVLFDEERCWITNHFGINPVKGGNPPKDKNLDSNLNLRLGLFIICLIMWFKWNVCIK